MNEIVRMSTGTRDVLIVHVEVDLDVAGCGRVAAQLMPLTRGDGFDRVVVDVTGRFVSARGLRVLAHAVTTATGAGCSWAVAGLSGLPRRLCAQWYPAVPVHDSVSHAARAVGSARR
jgi:anti-anti-sigma regulatory factor